MGEIENLYRRLAENEQEAAMATLNIANHEKICAERYLGITNAHNELKVSIGGLQARLLQLGTMLLIGMAGILVKIVFFPSP